MSVDMAFQPIITDWGDQYTSKELENFEKSYGFEHVPVSQKSIPVPMRKLKQP